MNTIAPIRPKVLFKHVEERFPNQNIGFKVNIPSADIGGMTLLESSILVCLAKLTHATQLFEFGTFMGATTLLLADNTPPHAQVVTLDISPEELATLECNNSNILQDGNANDDFLRQQHTLHGARCIQRASTDIQQKIQAIQHNSLTLNTAQHGLDKRFDFIFIDGGHHYNIVEHDTANAYRMAKPNAVIAWHDYGSKIHTDVTEFLNLHGHNRTLYHVENTMIVFELLGEFSGLLDE